MKLLRDGQTRIVVATDAFSMGVDIPDIECSIQWGVDRKLTLCALQQRLGRAARTPEMQGIGVIYAPKSLLFHLGKRSTGSMGGPAAAQGDHEEVDEEQEWEDITEEVGIIADNRGRDLEELCLAVESGKMKMERVRELCRTMYRKANDLKRAEEEQQSAQRGRIRILSGGGSHRRLPTDNIDPGILWLLNTLGCRHRMLMTYFGYPDIFDERKLQRSWCCDRCAKSNNLDPDVTSTSGIKLQSSAIYYTEMNPIKKSSQLPPIQLSSEPFNLIKPFIKDSLEKWRTLCFDRLVQKDAMDPGMPVQFLLPDSVIESVIRGCNRQLDLEYIKLLFVKARVSLSSSTLRGKDFVDILCLIKAIIARHSPPPGICPDVIRIDSVVVVQSDEPAPAPLCQSGAIPSGAGTPSQISGTPSLRANGNVVTSSSQTSLDTTSGPKVPTVILPDPLVPTVVAVPESTVCTSPKLSVNSNLPSGTVELGHNASGMISWLHPKS